MKNCSNSNKFSQWFLDRTYNAIPRNNNNFKLLLLIGYNRDKKNLFRSHIILIKNENKEIFFKILKNLIGALNLINLLP